ncbi:hypothetical protein JCM10212_006536 [Sporobolomyces blumeae]
MSLRPTLLTSFSLPVLRQAPSTIARRSLPRLSRPASSSSSSSATQAASTLSAADLAAARQIDWPTYLSLRKSQRVYGLVASVPTTLLGFFGGASYFATIESDPTDLILGLQPVYIYGIATIGCIGLGWLAGPIVGGGIWRLLHRRSVKSMEAKDKDFFAHVVKNRADASRNSVANPIPDYYAEKVGSLTQYRHWLRDQRTFMRKSAFKTEE